MILFEKDWAEYPDAIIDLKTSNRSFVRLASVYREMGIQNHAFLLALHNPALQGIDPHSPHLTLAQQGAILIECKVNPWYFFREVVRVPAIGGGDPIPLEANRGNMTLFWCFFNHIMIILIQIRQTGKSLSTDILMALLMNVICEKTQINLVTKDDVLRRANIARIKDICADLPAYVRRNNKDDVNNGEEITVRALGNVYKTHVPQSSPKRAYNMGRGLTSAVMHFDEGPFQPNISISLPAALSATGAAVDRAKILGAPYGTILTTTAGKKDDKDGKYVYDMVQDAAEWTEKFFDAPDEVALDRMVRGASRSKEYMVNATFSHRQLGKSDAWLKEKLEASRVKGDDANRDFFNLWTSGSQSNPLPLKVLAKIAESRMDVLYTDISKPHGYVTRWYIPEETIHERMTNGRFVLGMDTSEAGGGDDISLVLVDIENLQVVAAGTYNETNLIVFSEWVCSIFVQYKNVTGIIERRSTGAMLLDYLLLMLPQAGEDPFKRLYNRVVQDYAEDRERFKEACQPMGRRNSDIYTRYKTCFGWATSGNGATSRTSLYSNTLQLAAERAGDRVHDKSLAAQILGLVVRNGRVDHEQGEHDDLIIGWLLCHWLLTLGTNLMHYGIDIKRVMSMVNVTNNETAEEEYARFQQQTIRDKIEALNAELLEEDDEYVSAMLETQLRVLDRQVVLQVGEVYSIDELIRNAKEAKRARKRVFTQSYAQDARSPYGYAQAPAWMAQQGMMSNRPLSARDLYSR
jgi:hypothetical protein